MAKNKTSRILIWLAAGIATVTFIVAPITKAAAITKLFFDLGTARIAGMKGINPVIELGIKIRNASAETFKITFAMLDLFVDNSKIATVDESNFKSLLANNPNRFTIPPRGSVTIPIQVEVSALGAGLFLATALLNKTKPQYLKVDGFLRAGGYTLPVKYVTPLAKA